MSVNAESDDEAGLPGVSAKDWLEHYRHDLQHMALGNGRTAVVNDVRAVCVHAAGHQGVLRGVVFAVDAESFDLAIEPGPSTYYSDPRFARIHFVDIVEMWFRNRWWRRTTS